jgi:Zn-dependent peptidase ImmA (M78 family)
VMRIGRNKFVRRIMSEVCESQPYAAVQRLVRRHRNPGDTLEQVAWKLGVRGITITRMSFDGGIFEEASELVIRLNSQSSPRRRRFTLAHEIAHLIVASADARGAQRSHACTELERACDLVAAELLMPSDEFSRAAPGRGSTAGLLAIADQFGVSSQSAAVRLRELGMWTESIGQWLWDAGRARELWFVGKRFWREKSIYLSTFHLAVRQGSEAKDWELIEDEERGQYPVFLDVRKLGKEKVYLLAVVRD